VRAVGTYYKDATLACGVTLFLQRAALQQLALPSPAAACIIHHHP
jgi:hypothetical protein